MPNNGDYTGERAARGDGRSGAASADGRSKATTAGGRAGDSGVARRRFLQAAGAGVVGASMAGCTGGGTDQDDGGDGGDGGIEGPITIGVLAPVPAQNPIGASIANSAELAAQHLNDEGGIGGAEVEVSVKDTEENPSTGRSKYQELTVGEGVDVTTGIFTSEVLLNIMDDIAEQETVHLTTGAATPRASALVNEEYDRYKYHFRTGPINAHHLGVNLVDFAESKLDELGWESVAVLVEDYEWTHPVSDVLDDRLADTGIEIALSQRYAAGTENFTPIFDEVESSGADAAFTAMAHTGTPAIVQWAKQQRPFEFGGIHVPMQLPSYYGATQGACRFGVTQNSATPKSEITEKTIPYSDAYFEAYEQYPVYTGYITYDAVMQYAAAVEAVDSTAADDVVEGLEDSTFTGTAGTIEYYGRDHEFAHDVIYDTENVYPIYQQWQDDGDGGVQEVIFPDDLATAEYRKPPWV